jgi:hypothetical protein
MKTKVKGKVKKPKPIEKSKNKIKSKVKIKKPAKKSKKTKPVVKVSVTKQHIKDGERGDNCGCPVALALKDLDFKDVLVSPDLISLTDDGDWYPVSKKVYVFIRDFDEGLKVKPFSFTLDLTKKVD